MSVQRFGWIILALAAGGCGDDVVGADPIVEPAIRVTGTIVIPGTWMLDLETGMLDATPTGDVWNHAVGDENSLIEVRNGAAIAVMGGTEPDYAACLGATYGAGATQLYGLVPPQHFCVTTGEGRAAVVSVTVAPTLVDNGIEVDFKTWELPS